MLGSIMSPKELTLAWATWYFRHYKFRFLDDSLKPFLKLEVTGPWLKLIRKAKMRSITRVAGELGVTVSSYRKFEATEIAGSISINSLRRCAEALDCELVYAIRPKNRISLARWLWNELTQEMANDRWLNRDSGLLLAYLVRQNMYDTGFRARRKWGRNTEPEGIGIAIENRLMRISPGQTNVI